MVCGFKKMLKMENVPARWPRTTRRRCIWLFKKVAWRCWDLGRAKETSKSTGKKMEKENIGRIMRYDSVRRCETCMEFADHETHWCVVFVVPSACWDIGSYCIVLHRIGIFCLQGYAFMLCFRAFRIRLIRHDMTWQCTTPRVGYLPIGVASRRPRVGN